MLKCSRDCFAEKFPSEYYCLEALEQGCYWKDEPARANTTLPCLCICHSTVWTDTALHTEDLIDFLTRCSPGEAEEGLFNLEICFPVFPAEDMWKGIREINLGAQERDWTSISMSKGSCECWRCPTEWAEGLPSHLLWEATESVFKPRQLRCEGHKGISSFSEADLQLMQEDRLLYRMQLNV